MSPAAVSGRLRASVRRRAAGLCEYCRSSEQLTGYRFEVDHVLPRAQGGPTELDNLALACRNCNARKAALTAGLDSVSGGLVTLFNPRRQRWDEHFAWDDEGVRILPLTACGRVTTAVLQLNDALVVGARAIWASAGLHPPSA